MIFFVNSIIKLCKQNYYDSINKLWEGFFIVHFYSPVCHESFNNSFINIFTQYLIHLWLCFYVFSSINPKQIKAPTKEKTKWKENICIYIYSNINHNFISIWSTYEQHKQTTNEHKNVFILVIAELWWKSHIIKWRKRNETKKTLALKLALIFFFFLFSLVT